MGSSHSFFLFDSSLDLNTRYGLNGPPQKSGSGLMTSQRPCCKMFRTSHMTADGKMVLHLVDLRKFHHHPGCLSQCCLLKFQLKYLLKTWIWLMFIMKLSREEK
ncbi:inactive poly [ADP-ribose] polymerase RCD1 [Iris pallida]|uniref:Inactive poly [ADP-ribose] polymerase RCD1 n=1 Tax=Iris pallida TaxID=29817 RepID=A0AAX6F6C3_IRIPA|nr:inactive poly [ADP-ribose] polymerase RCD1 [Iris pallida]